MKREIYCPDCSEGFQKRTTYYPGEHTKIVSGTTRNHCWCDHCGKPILRTEKCSAVSIWADHAGGLYYEWETDCLENITETKQLF